MNTAYILTGGNLGDRLSSLLMAKEYIGRETGNIVSSSSIYETEAWGNNSQPDFYNQVHITTTGLSAEQMMKKILEIEGQMGRVRAAKNAPRIIDIDILFYNDEIINIPDLIIPHPRMQDRKFVLMPLNEIAANHMHPVLHKTINRLLKECPDQLDVHKIH